MAHPDKPLAKSELEYGSADAPTWTIKPPNDVRELVRRAMIATGKSRQTILMQVVREKIGEVVQKHIAESEAARRSFCPPGDRASKP